MVRLLALLRPGAPFAFLDFGVPQQPIAQAAWELYTGVGDAGARAGEHLGRLVDAEHAAAVTPGERPGNRARAGRDIEHARAGRDRHAVDEKTPPARILPQREDRGPAVVVGAERREQRSSGRADRGLHFLTSSSG